MFFATWRKAESTVPTPTRRRRTIKTHRRTAAGRKRIVPKDFGSYGNKKSRKRPECRLGLCNTLRSYREVVWKANGRGHRRSQSQELRPESGVHLFGCGNWRNSSECVWPPLMIKKLFPDWGSGTQL